MRSRLRPSFLAALFLPLIAVACGAGPEELPYTGPRGPDEFNACALFPASEAQDELPGEEVGQLAGPLDASSGTTFARCAYGHGPGAILDAALDVRRHASPEVLRRTLEGALPMLRRLSAGDLTAVFGIGDRAWWAGGGVRMLKVGWRDLELTVSFQPGDDAALARAAAERIARRAIFRLAGEPVPADLLGTPRTMVLGPVAGASSTEP